MMNGPSTPYKYSSAELNTLMDPKIRRVRKCPMCGSDVKEEFDVVEYIKLKKVYPPPLPEFIPPEPKKSPLSDAVMALHEFLNNY